MDEFSSGTGPQGFKNTTDELDSRESACGLEGAGLVRSISKVEDQAKRSMMG